MCGKIVATGKNASSKWTDGQRVVSTFNQSHVAGQIKAKDMSSGLGLPLDGVLAEYRVFPVEGLVAVPDYLSDNEAACLPIAAVTAWMSINWMQPMGKPITSPETTVLLQGTGGVSISGLQIAKACGLQGRFSNSVYKDTDSLTYSVIVTSSSDEKLEKARKLGADHLVNYKTNPDWEQKVMELTSGEGVDIILENGGAETLEKSFGCITFGGLISCVGYLSGREDLPGKRPNINVLTLMKNVTVKGIYNGPRDRFEEMLELYAQKQIHPVIDKVFDFDQGKEALQYISSGAHFGKVVIKVA